MKKSSLLKGIAFITPLIFAIPAMAQSGGGAMGGGSSTGNRVTPPSPTANNIGPAVPPPTAAQINAVNNILSPARYLNGGDYAGALSAVITVRVDRDNGYEINAINGGARPADIVVDDSLSGLVTALRTGDFPVTTTPRGNYTAGETQSSNFGIFIGDPQLSYDHGSRYFGMNGQLILQNSAAIYRPLANQSQAQGQLLPSGSNGAVNTQYYSLTSPGNLLTPPAGNSTRQVSNYESAQIANFRNNTIPALQQSLATAQQLLAATREVGDQGVQDRALFNVQVARNQLNQANDALRAINNYSGRAFASDADATRYISVLASANHLPTSIQASADAHQQLARDLNTVISTTTTGISREMRANVEASIRSEQAILAPSLANSDRLRDIAPESPQDRAALRARYGDRVDLVPDYTTISRILNSPTQHVLTDLPDPRNPNANNNNANNNRPNNNQANNSNQASNNSSNSPAPIDMPRQPDGTVPYPTYNGPSQAQIERTHNAAQQQARQVDPNSQTGQTIGTNTLPDNTGDDNPTSSDTSVTDATTGGHVEVTPYNATDGAIAGVSASQQAMAEAAAARAQQGNARNLGTQAFNTAVANTRQVTGGQSIQIARLANIYQGYNVNGGNASATVHGTGPSSAGTSLSAAGYSLSAAGVSLSAAGRSLSAGGNVGFSYAGTGGVSSAGNIGFSYAGVGGVSSASNGFSLVTQGLSLATYGFSLAGGPFVAGDLGLSDPAMRGIGANDTSNPWTYAPQPRQSDVAAATMNAAFQTQSDPTGRSLREAVNARYVASLIENDAYLSAQIHSGQGGLDRLLAQPFNVVLTWGAQAYDLDLHMTGPTGEGSTDRFHIYFSQRGSQTQFPFAELIKDCICNSGSEVILTSQLVKGGVYRISAFNFGDQSATSNNLSALSQAEIQIVRGGTAVANGNGTTIIGGRVIYRGKPPPTGNGNTWTAVEINARTGRIFAPDTITQSGGSGSVR